MQLRGTILKTDSLQVPVGERVENKRLKEKLETVDYLSSGLAAAAR
jgi:hypothetical protein